MAYTYRATVEIAAPVEAVWSVLVDFPAYAEWNPFTTSVQCSLEPGTMVVMRVAMPGAGPLPRHALTQRETLRRVEPPHVLAWALDIGMPWLLGAERVQLLTATAEGCVYETVDTIGGLLAPLVNLLYGRDLDAGFAGVAAGLAQAVARRGRHAGPPRS
jgi:uncharacterized protein YndB with AHSA1/START domain